MCLLVLLCSCRFLCYAVVFLVDMHLIVVMCVFVSLLLLVLFLFSFFFRERLMHCFFACLLAQLVLCLRFGSAILARRFVFLLCFGLKYVMQ